MIDICPRPCRLYEQPRLQYALLKEAVLNGKMWPILYSMRYNLMSKKTTSQTFVRNRSSVVQFTPFARGPRLWKESERNGSDSTFHDAIRSLLWCKDMLRRVHGILIQ